MAHHKPDGTVSDNKRGTPLSPSSMDLRDYIAIKIMAADIAAQITSNENPNTFIGHAAQGWRHADLFKYFRAEAKLYYKMADVMLEEREATR
jgi:hypothetical protein